MIETRKRTMPNDWPTLRGLARCFAGSLLCLTVCVAPLTAAFAEEPAATLDELLERVQSNWRKEKADNQKREAAFATAKKDQARQLADAKAQRKAEQKRSTQLEAQFEKNELALAEQEELLADRLGNLGELFGVVRQVAGDTRGQVESSIVSAEFPGRDAFLGRLGQSKALPDIEDLEKLYATLLQEMVEGGKVTSFRTSVVAVNGQASDREVIRIGAFNAVSGGDYLVWSPQTGKLAELGKQPAGKYHSTASALENATSGIVPFALDPARGAILQVLIKTPSFWERLQYGGYVGYTIMGLGAFTFLIGLVRLVVMMSVSTKVRSQRKNPGTIGKNPLGRVIEVYQANRTQDIETLELKMEETILQETSKLERYLWMIKVVSAVAPLMGLLGTVTGMIRTFQIITLFGTGDPKLMAGGISEALVTTMLGLAVAIPLVLLHSWLASTSKSVIDILEEQGTGLVAECAESDDAGATA
jgi:biopolymer transport protein ExbB